MGKKLKKTDNYLDLIPKIVNGQKWTEDGEGLVSIIILRNSLLEKMVRPFIKSPKTMTIDLDGLGSCVWKSIDGKRTVEEVGDKVKLEFGEDAEPLYERLSTYINILRNNKLVTLEKK